MLVQGSVGDTGEGQPGWRWKESSDFVHESFVPGFVYLSKNYYKYTT